MRINAENMLFKYLLSSHQIQLVFDWYAQENEKLEEVGNGRCRSAFFERVQLKIEFLPGSH